MSHLDPEPTERGRLPATLRADCSRCVGVCCVADAFYAIQGFGFDKPAESPCKHLTERNRCAIHAQRASRGFAACVGFDCYGAGQRLTRELGLGPSWRDSPETAARVFATYGTYVALHRLMATLAVAERDAAPALRARLRLQRAELEELCAATGAGIGTSDLAALRARIMRFVRDSCSPGPG
jgi:hypothetical protein